MRKILLIISILLMAFIVYFQYKYNFLSQSKNLILLMAAILFMLTCLIIFYKDSKIINFLKSLSNKEIKVLYFCFSFVIFSIYYFLNDTNFCKFYSKNVFGIEQNQYVFIINLIFFLVISLLVYALFISNIFIKRIDKNGVELAILNDFEDIGKTDADEINKIVKNQQSIICKVDEYVEKLRNNGGLVIDCCIDEFGNLIYDLICQYVSLDNNLNIILKTNFNNFKDILKNEYKFNTAKINNISTLLSDQSIHIENDLILINYKSVLLDEHMFFLIQCKNVYKEEIARLLFSSIIVFEITYSKYILDDGGS